MPRLANGLILLAPQQPSVDRSYRLLTHAVPPPKRSAVGRILKINLKRLVCVQLIVESATLVAIFLKKVDVD